jgi:DNA-binding FadR family transcriptional regulator
MGHAMSRRTDAGSEQTGNWRPVRGGRASEEVVDQVKAAFFDGMKPGDWLGTETELAERFGVSRITIRDAIRALEAQGVVAVRVGARGGLRVADADPARHTDALSVQLHLMGLTWEELAEAMSAVEPFLARLAAERATTDDLDRLRAIVSEQRASVDDPPAFTDLALDFHSAVAEAARNKAILAYVRALRTVQHAKFEEHTSHQVAVRVARMHGQILDAIAAGDGDAAAAKMSEHVALVTHHKDDRRAKRAAAKS